MPVGEIPRPDRICDFERSISSDPVYFFALEESVIRHKHKYVLPACAEAEEAGKKVDEKRKDRSPEWIFCFRGGENSGMGQALVRRVYN